MSGLRREVRYGGYKCTKCGNWKAPEEFKERTGGCGRQSWCRHCQTAWKALRRREGKLRVCSTCKKRLPRDSFSNSRLNSGGKTYHCKECAKKLQKAYREMAKARKQSEAAVVVVVTEHKPVELLTFDYEDIPIGAL